MITAMYAGMLVISLVYLIITLMLLKERVTVYYVLLALATVFFNYGYMQLSMAQSVEVAIVATQTAYLSNCFSCFFLVACIAQISRVKVPLWLCGASIVGGCAMFVASMTIGKSDIFYKSVDIIRENGYTSMVKEYGPLHIAYPIYIVLIMCYGIGIVIYSLITKKKVSVFSNVALIIILSMCTDVYFLERILGLKYELLPIAYAMGYGIILILLRRIKLYDARMLSMASLTDSKEYGLVAFDESGRLSVADEVASEWFPELRELRIDFSIENPTTDFLRQIVQWTKTETSGEVAYFEANDKIIEVSHLLIEERKSKLTHCIRLRDDTEEQQYLKLMENYNETLASEVEKKTETLREVQEDIIISMASIVENRDNNTGGHIRRTSDVVKIFIEHIYGKDCAIELDEHVAKRIVKAAPLHDFGKIAIPDVILNKPGKFTPEEYEEMKKHSAKGAVIVERILQNSEDLQFKKIAVNVAHYHHEKWDGSGYPEGLSRTDIPFEARVMALADVFDALVSKRVYKEQFDYDKAFRIIEESCGTHFDPDLCREFLGCRECLINLYDSYGDEE